MVLAKEAASNLDEGGIVDAKFGCKMLLPKSLHQFYQQLMTEAPEKLHSKFFMDSTAQADYGANGLSEESPCLKTVELQS